MLGPQEVSNHSFSDHALRDTDGLPTALSVYDLEAKVATPAAYVGPLQWTPLASVTLGILLHPLAARGNFGLQHPTSP